ncbi:hypothetical protein HMPREF9494_01245 [Enterococcus faecalis TX2137]|nr:hypothetical protein HMPREF9494_01245 [Enterococcus faecalis TX2137]
MLSAAVNPLVLEQGLPHRRGTTDSFPFPELKKAHVCIDRCALVV